MSKKGTEEVSPLLRTALRAAMDILVVSNGNPQCERDKNIVSDYIDGNTMLTVSEKYGLSKERVRQILVHTAVSISNRATRYDDLRMQVSELKRDLELSEMRKKCLQDIVLRNKWKADYKKIPPILYEKLDNYDFSTRAVRCIRSLDLTYVWQLAAMTKLEVMNAYSCGETTANQLECFLESHGLHFGMDVKGIYGLCDDKREAEQ